MRGPIALLSTVSLLLSLLPPAVAQAGACPVCTSNADCTAIPGSVCVLHNGDVGCGELRQLCCPGQGCALEGGVPSWLGISCVLVESSDAGLVDSGGAPPSDAASTDLSADTGVPAPDTGLPPIDGGANPDAAPAVDVGVNTGGGGGGSSRTEPDSACACTSAETAGGPLGLLSLLGLLGLRRRR